MREVSELLEDPEADEDEKARAMRKMLHDPFKDLDAFLSDGGTRRVLAPLTIACTTVATSAHARARAVSVPRVACCSARGTRLAHGALTHGRGAVARHVASGEMHELNELKSRPSENDPQVMAKLQALLATATQRRIEAKIDELLDREDDILV